MAKNEGTILFETVVYCQSCRWEYKMTFRNASQNNDERVVCFCAFCGELLRPSSLFTLEKAILSNI